MSRYKILDQHSLHFVTLTVVDWVDVFVRKNYRDILLESLRYCQKEKGLVVYAFVIMSSHVHLIAEASGENSLSEILRDFKKFTSHSILSEIETESIESRKEWLLHRFAYHANKNKGNRQYQLWIADNHPIQLFTLPVIAQKINYIHNNPVVEGWVEQPEHYLYSSASNYANGNGVLKEVKVVEFPLSWEGFVQG